MKKIAILGSTGSIGLQTLDVLQNLKDFNIYAISTYNNTKLLLEQIKFYKPKIVGIVDEKAYYIIKDQLPKNIDIFIGDNALVEIAKLKYEYIVVAINGQNGAKIVIESIKTNKKILIANKEAIINGSQIIFDLIKLYPQSRIIPLDSEHNAIWQCLENKRNYVENIYLTCSGGPFLHTNIEDLDNITVKQAINHPKWKMGKKISIDSATLFNKGLELIETMYLFDIEEHKIKIIIHKESIIHAIVEFVDKTSLMHSSMPDMRFAIQYSLTYPRRKVSNIEKINYNNLSLSFTTPDYQKFRSLIIARDVAKSKGIMPIIMNSANSIAVDLFFNNKIKFKQITDIVEDALNYFPNRTVHNIIEVDEIIKSVEDYVTKKNLTKVI